MKIALLIQAHRNPEQVARLCSTLRHPAFDLYLNIDLKSDIAAFRQAIPDAAYIDRRVDIRWGGFSQVRAALNGMEQILHSPQTYDFIMLLSGQDYPVIPIEHIFKQLQDHPGSQFMSGRIVKEGDEKNRNRFLYRHVALKNSIRSSRINRLIRICTPPRRHIPFPTICKGSQWWTLSGDCARYVLDFSRNHPEIMRFFRQSHCADEMFFQTIVLHSAFAASVVPHSYRYTDWSDLSAPHPKTLTAADYDRIVSSDAWLARKFDAQTDSRILDMLDKHISKYGKERERHECV